MNGPQHNGVAGGLPAPVNHERLLHLLEITLQRDSAVAESDELEQMLLASDAARTTAVRFFNLQSLLDRFECEPPADSDAATSTQPRLGNVAPAALPVAPDRANAQALAAAQPRSPIFGFLSLLSSKLPGGDATVGALIMLGIVSAFWGLAQLTSHSLEPSTRAVTMRASQDVRWSANCSQVGRTTVPQAERLEIEAGAVELQLPQGATLVVEGPARWSIDGDNAATLLAGRLVARVPPQAVGFALTTPTAQIVDLGTEFGVTVDSDRLSEIVVLKGAVRVEPQARQHEHPSRAVTVSAGESVQVRRRAGQGFNVDRVRSTTQFTTGLDPRQRPARAPLPVQGSVLPRAQVVIEDSGLLLTATANESRLRAADNDLLQTALDPAQSVVPPSETKGRFDGQQLAHLFNGQLYHPAWKDFSLGRTEDSYSAADETPLEFYLDTRRSPCGYDILRIETITGTIRCRTGQRYLVAVRLVGERQFQELVPVAVDIVSPAVDFDPATYERKVVVSGHDGQPLATGVEAIRIVLLKLEGENPESVYREIDVIGAPAP